jgi:hypothetical protein
VSRCLAEAEAVTPDHHFRVVQLPLNLYEPGGALERNNDGRTVLEFCSEAGIGVLANRPLNAFPGGRLIRLADWSEPGSPIPRREELHAVLTPLREHEEVLRSSLGEELRLGHAGGIAAYLEDLVLELPAPEHWEETAGPMTVKAIRDWVARCGRKHAGNPVWEKWRQAMGGHMTEALQGIRQFLRSGQQAASDRVRGRLLDAGHPNGDASLSRMALGVLTSLEGLSCTLVGMRQRDYVEDAMGVEALEEVDGRSILERFDRSLPV